MNSLFLATVFYIACLGVGFAKNVNINGDVDRALLAGFAAVVVAHVIGAAMMCVFWADLAQFGYTEHGLTWVVIGNLVASVAWIAVFLAWGVTNLGAMLFIVYAAVCVWPLYELREMRDALLA